MIMMLVDSALAGRRHFLQRQQGSGWAFLRRWQCASKPLARACGGSEVAARASLGAG
jgi:hypothetical protein